MQRLDKVDRKILYELLCDSRTSLKQIAKTVKISKSAVNYRVDKLESEGIIRRYTTLVDYKEHGILYGRVTFKLMNISSAKYKQIIACLKAFDDICWLASTQGSVADIALVVKSSSVEAFALSLEKIQEEVGSAIKAQEVSIGYSVYHCSPNVLFNKKFIQPVLISYPAKQRVISEFDKSLLQELEKNTKVSLVDLAQKLDCSTKKIISHKKDLEKKNIITRYSLQIDTNKLDFETYHIYWKFNTWNKKELDTFIEYLLSRRESLFVTKALSHSNLECEFVVKNQRKLYQVIDEIKQKFPDLISDYDFMLIFDIHKNTF